MDGNAEAADLHESLHERSNFLDENLANALDARLRGGVPLGVVGQSHHALEESSIFHLNLAKDKPKSTLT